MMTKTRLQDMPMDIYLQNLSLIAEKQRFRALINTAHFMAKEDIAMAKFSQLCDLQVQNGVAIGENYHNDRAVTTKKELSDEIKEAR